MLSSDDAFYGLKIFLYTNSEWSLMILMNTMLARFSDKHNLHISEECTVCKVLLFTPKGRGLSYQKYDMLPVVCYINEETVNNSAWRVEIQSKESNHTISSFYEATTCNFSRTLFY